MNACIQPMLDFSIFILQFNFFNGFASLEKNAFADFVLYLGGLDTN